MRSTSSAGDLDRDDLDPDGIATRGEFAAALTAVREVAGLTVREVARLAGISPSTAGGYYSGRHLPPLRPDGGLRSLLLACGVDDPRQLDAWQRALARVRRSPGPRPGALPSPYPGLRPLGPDDADRFHGRDGEVEALLTALDGADGVVALVGEAGSGKSSLLGAGLLPRLHAAGRPTAAVRPGRHPLLALARALGGDAALAARLAASPAAVRDVLTGSPVLVVDPLEDLFAQGSGVPEQAAFTAALGAACRPGPDGPAPAAVVVALRSRFLSQAAAHPDLRHALAAPAHGGGAPRTVLLTAPGPLQVRAVVLGPARAAGLDVDDELVERVLADSERTPAPALPRLAHCLDQAWRQSPRTRLTLADWARTPGPGACVAVGAEEVLDRLPDGAREAARRLLTGLWTPTPGGAVPAPAAEAGLEPGLQPGPGEVDRAVDRAVAVRAFVEAGLLAAGPDGVRAVCGTLPELWPRLAHWLDADADAALADRPLVDPAPADPGPADPADVTQPGEAPARSAATPALAVALALAAVLMLLLALALGGRL